MGARWLDRGHGNGTTQNWVVPFFCMLYAMTQVRHKMLERDIDSGTGVCVVCGPVQLVRKNYGGGKYSYVCAIARGDSHRGTHGLSKSEADALRVGKSCAICGGVERLHIDHCHVTGVIRSVLCHWCNTGLGLFKDSVELLGIAAAYLSSFQEDARPAV